MSLLMDPKLIFSSPNIILKRKRSSSSLNRNLKDATMEFSIIASAIEFDVTSLGCLYISQRRHLLYSAVTYQWAIDSPIIFCEIIRHRLGDASRGIRLGAHTLVLRFSRVDGLGPRNLTDGPVPPASRAVTMQRPTE